MNPREDGCDDVPPAASANDDGGCVDNSDHLDALPETGVPDVIHPPVSREKDGSVCVTSMIPAATITEVNPRNIDRSDCSASNKPAATITEENPAKIGAMFDHCYTMMSVGSSLTSTPSHPVLINEELGQSGISASVGADGSTGDTVLTHGGPGQGGASVSVEAEVVGDSAPEVIFGSRHSQSEQ